MFVLFISIQVFFVDYKNVINAFRRKQTYICKGCGNHLGRVYRCADAAEDLERQKKGFEICRMDGVVSHDDVQKYRVVMEESSTSFSLNHRLVRREDSEMSCILRGVRRTRDLTVPLENVDKLETYTEKLPRNVEYFYVFP